MHSLPKAATVSIRRIDRITAANAYARAKGLNGLVAISNNYSLARMVEPTWPGCLASSDPDSRAWFTKAQMPLISWSSQACGFFARGREEDRSETALVRSWYSADNFRRLERAKELAAKYHVSPTNIALAYVLCQPFLTFAIVGPGSVDRLRATLPALEISLTPAELRWLNLEVQYPGSSNHTLAGGDPVMTKASPDWKWLVKPGSVLCRIEWI